MLAVKLTKKLPSLYTRTNQVIIDACVFAGSMALAAAVYSRGQWTAPEARLILIWLPVMVGARVAMHSLLGIYRLVWRFVSISDALKIARSLALVTVIFGVAALLYPTNGNLAATVRVPAPLLILELLFSLNLSLAIRAARRMHYNFLRRASVAADETKRVLLYGAGRAGMMLRKEMENSASYDVAGFIDDDAAKVGTLINDTPVLGKGDELRELVGNWEIDEIIISMATASRSTLARTLAKCRRAGVPAKIIPSLGELLGGNVRISELRDTELEEVLGRESVEVPGFASLAGPSYRGKRILVTGAGGSIGSELVRQIVTLRPAKVALLDKDENAVYELDQELRRHGFSERVEPYIADVRELSRLRAIFSEFRPQVIFHAAAHKHVPLMEVQPCEAVLNNVGGIKNLLDVTSETRVELFVFISTDKAVNPVNVMGATKRIGEMLVQAQTHSALTRFGCVRFGNVLGSRGSVIPLFAKQIAEGGPVTVTHPDVVRYFMTIQEAVQLILCAGTLARHGEIFVLDMGNPRNILELAREMILLSGFEPEKDIHTQITGLRPGEKLTEELVAPAEKLRPTALEKLSLIEPQTFDRIALFDDVRALLQCARNNDVGQLSEMLHTMNLGYQALSPKALVARAGIQVVSSFPRPSLAIGAPQESTL